MYYYNAATFFNWRVPGLLARNSVRYADRVPNYASFAWINIDSPLHMMAPCNIFECWKLLSRIPLFMVAPTPTSSIVRSYHQGNGVHPYKLLLEDIKLFEVGMNLGGECQLNDGG